MSNGGGKIDGLTDDFYDPGDTKKDLQVCWMVPGTGGYSGNGAGYMGGWSISGPKGIPWK